MVEVIVRREWGGLATKTYVDRQRVNQDAAREESTAQRFSSTLI
jgi:hypothetical protein